MPLGDKLGSNDDIRPPVSDCCNPLFQGSGRAKKIRRQNRKACVRELGLSFLCQTFNARSNRCQFALNFTTWAGVGHGFTLAALMAKQSFEKTMFNHARITMIASNLMATGSANGHRRIATSIDKQQRLLALSNSSIHRSLKAR